MRAQNIQTNFNYAKQCVDLYFDDTKKVTLSSEYNSNITLLFIISNSKQVFFSEVARGITMSHLLSFILDFNVKKRKCGKTYEDLTPMLDDRKLIVSTIFLGKASCQAEETVSNFNII